MANYTQKARLNLEPGRETPKVYISQYDTDMRQIALLLYDGDNLYAPGDEVVSAKVQMRTATNTIVEATATLVTSGTETAAVFGAGAFSDIPGNGMAELILYGANNNRVASGNFIIMTEESPEWEGVETETAESWMQQLEAVKTEALEEISAATTSAVNGVYTTEYNNPVFVNQFVGVGWSYYDNRKDSNDDPVFTYGQTTCLDEDWSSTGPNANNIDCSTFIGLVLRGLTFQNGPYNFLASDPTDTGDGTDHDSGMPDDDPDASDTSQDAGTLAKSNDYEWAINPGKYQGTPIRTAAQLAEWFYRNGRIVYPGSLFENIEKGDIVFYARKDDDGWVQPDRFMHISHVAMIANKIDNNGTDISAAFPFKHTMLESTKFASNPETLVNRCLEKVNLRDIVLFARPYLGTISPDDVKGNDAASKTTINNIYTAGVRYLTSTTVTGLPEGVTNGLGMALVVERIENKKGRPYSLIQRLIDARNNREWRRTQYCYSNNYTPTTTGWTAWVELT